MSKIGILLPHPALRQLAASLIVEYPRLSPASIEYVPTSMVGPRVTELARGGCEMLLARGLHAKISRDHVVIPIVEMHVGVQELAIQIFEMRKLLESLYPQHQQPFRIGAIGFSGMFHATEQLGKLLSVDLRIYSVRKVEDYPLITETAIQDGCSGLIGGESVCQKAAEMNTPAIFLSMSEESLREAFETASLVSYTNDLLKRSAMEMDAMLTYTFSGIMQVNGSGIIQRVNRACEGIIGKSSDQIVGQDIRTILTDVKEEILHETLTEGHEVQGEVLLVNSTAVLTNIVPIKLNGKTENAIFTFQEQRKLAEMHTKIQQELYQNNYPAKCTFDTIIAKSPEYSRLISQLKRISKYSAPVLLLGEPGSRLTAIAECIHNASVQRGPFLFVDCSAWHPDDLDNLLFGKYSSRREEPTVIEQAQNGTLHLMHVDALQPEVQYKLLLLVRGQYFHNGSNLPESVDLRLILSSNTDLRECVRSGRFRHDLYYAISVLEMHVPPLRQRREDIPELFDTFLKLKQAKYGRDLQLDEEASEFIINYPWPGNLEQMDNLCERLFLLERRRIISCAALKHHLGNSESSTLMPGNLGSAKPESGTLSTDPRAQILVETLKRNFGSRDKTAQELGISKTTLWRRMKAYGIDPDLPV